MGKRLMLTAAPRSVTPYLLTMCNRFRLAKRPQPLEIPGLGTVEFDFSPRYNVAPTQPAPVALLENGRLVCRDLAWGFKPAWSRGPVTNAMIETAACKPTFKDAFATRRCLVPASAFYEFVDFNSRKQPVMFTLADESPFFFAGLWSQREQPGNFVILTTAANDAIRDVHDRMPLIVAPSDYDAWMNPAAEGYKQVGATTAELKRTWVNPRMNNSRIEDEAAARPLVARVETCAGAVALPNGLPEGATVRICGFNSGSFDVEHEGRRFRVDSLCVRRNGW